VESSELIRHSSWRGKKIKDDSARRVVLIAIDVFKQESPRFNAGRSLRYVRLVDFGNVRSSTPAGDYPKLRNFWKPYVTHL